MMEHVWQREMCVSTSAAASLLVACSNPNAARTASRASSPLSLRLPAGGAAADFDKTPAGVLQDRLNRDADELGHAPHSAHVLP